MENVSLVGATGIVGQELIRLLEKRNFPMNRLRCFASENSCHKTVSFRGRKILIERANPDFLVDEDLIFFCTNESVSKQLIPSCLNTNALIIDLSSAFRQDDTVPLVIPEINFEKIKDHRLIASPNCVASIMALCIANLHRRYKLQRIVASTYQAASGGGAFLLQSLLQQSKAYLNSENLPAGSVAFNAYLHDSEHSFDRYSSEEKKISKELKKILDSPDIKISVTAVRIPVIRSHAISMNLQFLYPFSLPDVEKILQNTEGLSLIDNYEQSKFATSLDAIEKEHVFCSRIRVDPSCENTLEIWTVADQLLKGAALNAVQIAEKMIKKNLKTPNIS